MRHIFSRRSPPREISRLPIANHRGEVLRAGTANIRVGSHGQIRLWQVGDFSAQYLIIGKLYDMVTHTYE